MKKVVLQGYILVPPDALVVVKEELVTHTALTLQEPGCITFSVKQSGTDPCRFEVYEEFRDQATFDAHQARTRKSNWGKLSANVERHYDITEEPG